MNRAGKRRQRKLAKKADRNSTLGRARLILKYGNMNADGNRSRFLDRFSAHGNEAARIILEGKSPHAELLARYNDPEY